MAFKTGIYTGHTEQKAAAGVYHDAAVQCWFTATGKSMPLMLKVKGEEGELITISPIRVLTSEKQWYAGILNWKYQCQTELQGKQVDFVLLFCPEECSWKLVC